MRLGRARAGLGVAELAARCCVTPRSVSTWETRGAPEARAEVLADAMAMPAAFLSASPLPEIEEPAVYFRARRRVGSVLLRRSTAIGALGAAFYTELTALLRLPRLNLPECTTADPAQAAQELRRAWRLGSQVVPSLVQLAEANGVRVLGVPQAEEDVDAFSFWGPHSHPYVFLTRGRTAERSRFDLAHELGHLVLHGAAPMGHERTDRSLEHEANRFAAAFLMPRDVVRAAVAGPASLDDLLELKARLGPDSCHFSARGGRWM